MELESGFYITAEIWEMLVLRGGNPREELGEEKMEKYGKRKKMKGNL